MSVPNIMNTGHSGMMAAKAAIATTGHNIANANTEGYSRQRVHTETTDPRSGQVGHHTVGTGTAISRVGRVNDEYLEKQIRNSQRDFSNFEEKDLAFRQIEDIFNEMNGDGLNRLVSRFFNEFRKLANEPENPAIRQVVKESSQAMVNDFHRIRKDVDEVRRHLDSRVEGYVREVNSTLGEIADINQRIQQLGTTKNSPNDLLDKRDLALKKLGTYFDISTHMDEKGSLTVDLKGVGPVVSGGLIQRLSTERTPADEFGKIEQAVDVRIEGVSTSAITHQIKNGKLGALIEARDKVLVGVVDRLDDIAYTMTESVNVAHNQGVTPTGARNVNFFEPVFDRAHAAERISLSEDVKASVNNIATALDDNSPGDNRIALAIARLQYDKTMADGTSTLDEYYNSIVSDVGVVMSRNRSDLNQQKEIMTQLGKVREQISGVSIDEETSFLLQFQHAFDASAKVIQVADEMFKTVLAIKRD